MDAFSSSVLRLLFMIMTIWCILCKLGVVSPCPWWWISNNMKDTSGKIDSETGNQARTRPG